MPAPPGYHYGGMPPETPSPLAAGFTSAIADVYQLHQRSQMDAYETARRHSENSMVRNAAMGMGIGTYGVMGAQQQGRAAFNRQFDVTAGGVGLYGGAIAGGAGIMGAGRLLTGAGSGRLVGGAVRGAATPFLGARAAGMLGGAASWFGWGLPIMALTEGVARPTMRRVRERAEIYGDIESMNARMGGGFGNAFTEETMRDIASDMSRSLRTDKFFDPDQSKTISKIGLATGMLKGRGKDEFLRNFKELKEAAKDVMMLLNTTLEGGMAVMADVRKMGMTSPTAIKNYIAQSRVMGAATGMGTGVMMQYGQAGAETVRGTGIAMGTAAMGQQRAVLQAQQMATMDPGLREYYAQVGGTAQAGQTLFRGQMGVLTSSMGMVTLASMYNPKTDKIDQEALQKVMSGQMSASQIRQRANVRFSSEDDRMRFYVNAPKMLNQMDPKQWAGITRGIYTAWAGERGRDPTNEAAAIAFSRQFVGQGAAFQGGMRAGLADIGIMSQWLANPQNEMLSNMVMARQRRAQQRQLMIAQRPGLVRALGQKYGFEGVLDMPGNIGRFMDVGYQGLADLAMGTTRKITRGLWSAVGLEHLAGPAVSAGTAIDVDVTGYVKAFGIDKETIDASQAKGSVGSFDIYDAAKKQTAISRLSAQGFNLFTPEGEREAAEWLLKKEDDERKGFEHLYSPGGVGGTSKRIRAFRKKSENRREKLIMRGSSFLGMMASAEDMELTNKELDASSRQGFFRAAKRELMRTATDEQKSRYGAFTVKEITTAIADMNFTSPEQKQLAERYMAFNIHGAPGRLRGRFEVLPTSASEEDRKMWDDHGKLLATKETLGKMGDIAPGELKQKELAVSKAQEVVTQRLRGLGLSPEQEAEFTQLYEKGIKSRLSPAAAAEAALSRGAEGRGYFGKRIKKTYGAGGVGGAVAFEKFRLTTSAVPGLVTELGALTTAEISYARTSAMASVKGLAEAGGWEQVSGDATLRGSLINLLHEGQSPAEISKATGLKRENVAMVSKLFTSGNTAFKQFLDIPLTQGEYDKATQQTMKKGDKELTVEQEQVVYLKRISDTLQNSRTDNLTGAGGRPTVSPTSRTAEVIT